MSAGRRRGRGALPAIALAVGLSLAACAREATAPPPAPAAAAPSVQSSAAAHGTTITARAEPSTAEVGVPITLTLELVREGGPPPTDALDGAVPETLGDFHAEPIAPPRLEGSTLVARYRISTFATGTVPVPPIVVGVVAGAADDAARSTTVATRELAITIASLLGDADADPSTFRDIKGELDLLPQPSRWPWIAGGSILGAGIIAAAVLILSRRRRTKLPPRADAVALTALEALEREALPKANRVHEFHVRLSDIVRHFIEDRFAIRAPELTTPEFLREAKASTAIPESHQATLEVLLKAADMVKFAAVRPDAGACDQSLASARTFVRENAPPEVAQ